MRNALKILLTILIDSALFAALIFGFAWFHHAKPQHYEPVVISAVTPKPTSAPTPTPDPTPVPTELPPNVTPGPTPEPTPVPTPEPTGLLGAKFAEKFTDGGVVYDENGYHSKNVCVEVSRHETTINGLPVCYCVADIYIRDITSFRCHVPDPEAGKEYPIQMARNSDVIVAASGDYFLYHQIGLIIRNGSLYRQKYYSSQDYCIIYMDGTMETYPSGMIDLERIYSKNPWHSFSFGPRLLDNGLPMTEFNTSVAELNPRSAIGYYEPGHYCMVVVDGRQRDYSYGMEMADLSRLMYDLGCTAAFNLDGGSTSVMLYHGEFYSRPPYGGGGRPNTDMLYIAEPLDLDTHYNGE